MIVTTSQVVVGLADTTGMFSAFLFFASEVNCCSCSDLVSAELLSVVNDCWPPYPVFGPIKYVPIPYGEVRLVCWDVFIAPSPNSPSIFKHGKSFDSTLEQLWHSASHRLKVLTGVEDHGSPT